MIQIGRFPFETITAARAHLVSFTRLPLGTVFVGDDHELLEAALAMHSEAAIKIGPGVAKFTVERHPAYPNTQCVFVHRIDGTKVAVSFQNLQKGKPEVQRKVRLRALREAIVPQILAYRDCRFLEYRHLGLDLRCQITGEVLRRETCEVDHVPPKTFQKLVANWLSSLGITLDDLDIHPPPHPKCELRSSLLRASWVGYHGANCELRLLSPEGHKIITAQSKKGGA